MKGLLLLLSSLVAALSGLALLLSGRRRVFWLAFLATLVPLEFIDRYYLDLPGSIKWLPEFAIVASATASVLLWPQSGAPFPRALVGVFAAVVAEALASRALNHSSLVALLLSQRGYVLLFGSILAIRCIRTVYDRDHLYALIVRAGIVSSLVCIVQRLTIARTDGDRVTGLFSLGEVVLFYHLVCIGIVLAYWLEGRRVGNLSFGFTLGILVLSLAIGNQEAALPYLGLIIGYLFLRARARRAALIGLGAALPAAMLLVFTLIYDASYTSREGSYSKAIFEPAYVKRYLFGEKDDVLTPGGDLLRGAAIAFAYREIEGDRGHLLLGRGPGTTSESSFAGASGALAKKYPGIGRVTLSLLLGDTGTLGVLLHVGLMVVVVRSRGGRNEPHEHRLVRELVVLISFAYFIYARLTYEPSYAWVLACVMHREGPGGEPASEPGSA